MPPPKALRLDPFATGCSDEIRAMLTARLAEAEPSTLWASRAEVLAEIMAPVLAWARDTKGIGLTASQVLALTRFDNLVAMAERRSSVTDPSPVLSDWSELPEPQAARVLTYLAELPGFDPSLPTPPESPARQIHAYAVFALRHSLN